MFGLIFFLQIFCCLNGEGFDPENAFPALESSWSGQEEIDVLGDLTIYRFGPGLNDKWILWAHDIYGPDSGRTKEYCNKMYTDFGITCILPDFFRGVSKPTPPPSWEFGGLREDWEFKINPYLLERGARKVGVVGTCFGSYIVIHTNADDFSGLMFGGVSIHPAHGGLIADNGEDEEVLYSNIRSPQYFMNTPDSPDTTRPEGLADQIIETTYFDEYSEPCSHGFFNRGDLTDPAVAECVNTAMDHLVMFVETYLVNDGYYKISE